jgi:hypothetical protein
VARSPGPAHGSPGLVKAHAPRRGRHSCRNTGPRPSAPDPASGQPRRRLRHGRCQSLTPPGPPGCTGGAVPERRPAGAALLRCDSEHRPATAPPRRAGRNGTAAQWEPLNDPLNHPRWKFNRAYETSVKKPLFEGTKACPTLSSLCAVDPDASPNPSGAGPLTKVRLTKGVAESESAAERQMREVGGKGGRRALVPAYPLFSLSVPPTLPPHPSFQQSKAEAGGSAEADGQTPETETGGGRKRLRRAPQATPPLPV